MKNRTKLALVTVTFLSVPFLNIGAKTATSNPVGSTQELTGSINNDISLSTDEDPESSQLRVYEATEISDEGVSFLSYQVEMTGNVEKLPDPKPAVVITYNSNGSIDSSTEYSISRFTRYGVDCYGCNIAADNTGGTASGVRLSTTAVRQSDGTWLQGITYNGYYIVAADKSIPFGTIIEIYDHNLYGEGISPGVPFRAIVLDRGGGVNGTEIDLFIGTESNIKVYGTAKNAKFKIVE